MVTNVIAPIWMKTHKLYPSCGEAWYPLEFMLQFYPLYVIWFGGSQTIIGMGIWNILEYQGPKHLAFEEFQNGEFKEI